MKFDKKVFNLVVPKKLALALLAGTVSLTAFADNKLKVQDIQILSGQTAVVSVYMENDENITTMQARVNLPEGLTLVASGKDEYEDDIYYILNQSRTYDPNDPDAQSKQRHEINFGALYQEPGADGSLVQITHPKNAPFVGTQGEIFYLTVKATDALADLSEITLTDAHFGTTSAQDIVPEVENGKVTKLAEPAGIGILTADDFIINPDGTEYELVLSLQNNYDLKALQFDLHLPKGLVIVPGKEGASTNAEGRMTNSRLNGDANEIEDGVWRITYSNPQSSPKIKLAAGEGPIIGIIVKATHELEKSAQIVIDNVTLTRPNLKEIEPDALVITVTNPNAAAMESAQLVLDDAKAQLEAAQASISEELRPVAAARALLRDEAVTTAKADVAAAWTAAQEAYDALKQFIEDAYQAGTLADADYQTLYNASIAADEALTAVGVQADALVAEYEYLDTQWAAYDKAVATVREGLKDNEKIKAAEKAATDAIKVLKTRIDDFYAEKKLAGADLAVQKQDVEDAIFNIVLAIAKAEAQERIDAANALAIDPETKAYQDDEVQAKVAQAEAAIAAAQQAANNLNTLIDNLGENLNTPQGQGQLGQALYQTDMTIAAAKSAIGQAEQAKAAAVAEAAAKAAAKEMAQQYIDNANALAVDAETEANESAAVQEKVTEAKTAIQVAQDAANNIISVIDNNKMNSQEGKIVLNSAIGNAVQAYNAAAGAIQAAKVLAEAVDAAKAQAKERTDVADALAVDPETKAYQDETVQAKVTTAENAIAAAQQAANNINTVIDNLGADITTDAGKGQLAAALYQADAAINAAKGAIAQADAAKAAAIAEAEAVAAAKAKAQEAIDAANALAIDPETEAYEDETVQQKVEQAKQAIETAKAAAENVNTVIDAQAAMNSPQGQGALNQALGQAAMALQAAKGAIQAADAAKAAAEQAKIEANAAAYAALNEAIDNLRKQLNDTKAAINAEDEDVARSFDLRANEIEDAINAAKRDLDARKEAVELNAESTLNPADLAEQIAQLKKDADEAQAEFEATAMAEVAVALADGLKISDEARNWPDENLQAEIALADQDIAAAKAAAKAVEDLIAANKGNINSDEFDAKMEEALEEAAAAYDKALESINGVEQGYQNLKKDADEQAAAQAAIAEAAADKAAADALVAPADVEGDEALQAYIDAAKEAVKAAKDGANALSEQVAADTEDGRLSDEQAAAFDAADQAVDEAIAAAEAAIAAAEDAIEAADAAAYERLKDKLNKLDGALGAAKSAIETGCPDVAAEYTDAAQAIEDQINALKTDLENKHADKALNAGSDYDTAAIEAAIEKMKKDAVDAQKTFNDNKEAKTYWDGVLAGLGTRLDQDKAAIAEDGLTSQFADDVDAIEKQIEDLKNAIDGAFEDRLLTNDSFNKEMEAIQALLAALEANHNVAVGITAAVLMKEKNAQFFTLSGKRIEVPMKGQMVIVKYADGKTKKVLVK